MNRQTDFFAAPTQRPAPYRGGMSDGQDGDDFFAPRKPRQPPQAPGQGYPYGAPPARPDGMPGRYGAPPRDPRHGGPGGQPSPHGPLRGPGRRPGKAPRWVRILLVLLAVLVVGGAVYALVLLNKVNSAFKEGGQDVQGLDDASLSQPMNILVVGSDSREGLSYRELQRIATTREDDGGRTDTMMIMHISPGQQKALMLSLPRDLKVQIDGRTEKINAAGVGGPDLLVRTVEANTGLDVNHYVEIDMAGFLKAVQRLGGVDMCIERPLRDAKANLNVKAGCQHFNETKAIAFVRSRHADNENDYGRMARQQQFMRAVMKKMTSGGTLLNPGKMLGLAEDLGPHLKHDNGLSVRDAVSVAQRMGDLSPETLDTRTLPATNQRACQTSACPSYEVATAEAFVLLDAIRRDQPAPQVGLTKGGASSKGVDLHNLNLQVFNGSGVAGAARTTAEALRARGFQAASAGNANQIKGKAVLTYPEAKAKAAKLLGSYLGEGVKLVEAGPEGPTSSLSLVVGPGFELPAAPPLEGAR